MFDIDAASPGVGGGGGFTLEMCASIIVKS